MLMGRRKRVLLGYLAPLGVIGIGLLSACAPDVGRGQPAAAPPPAAVGAPSVLGEAPILEPSPVTSTIDPLLPPVTQPPPEVPEVPVVPETILPAATPRPMRAPPISGGTLAVLSDGRTAVASDSDRDLVYVVDLVAAKLTAAVALQPGDEPGRLVEDGAGRVHVALRRGGAVVTLDPARGIILARRALCPAPRGLAVDNATGELHVACAGGELVSIDASPVVTVPRRTLTLDRDLRDVLVAGKAGQLMVSTFRTAEVLVVDGTTTTRLGAKSDGFQMTPAVAWRMVEGPDGKAMVLHQRGQTSALGTFPGAYSRGFGCGAIVDSAITVVAPDGSQTTSSGGLSETLVGADVAVSPDGTQIAVVSIGGADQGRQVQFFAVNAPDSTTTPFPMFPGSGTGCQTSLGNPQVPKDDRADAAMHTWLPRPDVYLPPNGQVIAVAFDPRGNVIVQSREPATLQILTQRLDAVVLSTDSRFDAGHQLFHTATSNRIACVSCHPEGGEDGRVWMFQALGARRTQSLRGGIMNTAPFHWSGDESNLTLLMKDVFQGRMAGGTIDAAGIEALGTWVNQIPTIPTSRWTDDATVARGKAVFAAAGCVACHAGADFTNSQTVDVGSGGLFQVPQLHGLGFRAPFMHNGCAVTLRDRFSKLCVGDQRHAVISSEAQIGDIVAYLDTL
jgi:DNA-binding beta-propeller fold protein YncE